MKEVIQDRLSQLDTSGAVNEAVVEEVVKRMMKESRDELVDIMSAARKSWMAEVLGGRRRKRENSLDSCLCRSNRLSVMQ